MRYQLLLLLLLLSSCCALLVASAAQPDLSEYDSEDEDEWLPRSSEEQLMPERVVGGPTKKPNASAKPSKQFAFKVRRVLQRHGLLRKMLAKTVVNVLSRSPAQLRRLDGLLHEEALKGDD